MMMLQPTELAREFVYVLSHGSVLLTFALLFLLLEFAIHGGVLGLIVALMVLPAFFRYLMVILESRARGDDPGPLEIDHVLWFGNVWSLFLIVHVAVVIYATYFLGRLYGVAAVLAANALLAAVIPASLAVLVITRSPLECMRPKSVSGVIHRCGAGYWVLPSYYLAAACLCWFLSTRSLPDFFVELIALYLTFALFALVGGVVRPHQFYKEVGIYDSVEPDQETVDEQLQKERTAVLDHAYGFISRDNRAGGFKHIHDWLQRDPAPKYAWQWFFNQMMRWEIKGPALLFAQTYLSRLLQDDDYEAAVKVIVRCRFVTDAFLPLREDRALALEAAEHCGKEELIGLLKQSQDRGVPGN
jgi:hypothetical protein